MLVDKRKKTQYGWSHQSIDWGFLWFLCKETSLEQTSSKAHTKTKSKIHLKSMGKLNFVWDPSLNLIFYFNHETHASKVFKAENLVSGNFESLKFNYRKIFRNLETVLLIEKVLTFK